MELTEEEVLRIYTARLHPRLGKLKEHVKDLQRPAYRSESSNCRTTQSKKSELTVPAEVSLNSILTEMDEMARDVNE